MKRITWDIRRKYRLMAQESADIAWETYKKATGWHPSHTVIMLVINGELLYAKA